jgi:hypothetical protein
MFSPAVYPALKCWAIADRQRTVRHRPDGIVAVKYDLANFAIFAAQPFRHERAALASPWLSTW